MIEATPRLLDREMIQLALLQHDVPFTRDEDEDFVFSLHDPAWGSILVQIFIAGEQSNVYTIRALSSKEVLDPHIAKGICNGWNSLNKWARASVVDFPGSPYLGKVVLQWTITASSKIHQELLAHLTSEAITSMQQFFEYSRVLVSPEMALEMELSVEPATPENGSTSKHWLQRIWSGIRG